MKSVDSDFRLETERLTAFVSEQNTPSIGLAEKLGLRYEYMARLVGDDEDVCLYSMSHD